jgi:hypothetical protein
MNEVKAILCLICDTEPNSVPSHEGGAAGQQVSFESMVDGRRNEAFRSILVQVQSEQSCCDLHKYCSQYGEVKGMHHYSLPGSLVCKHYLTSVIAHAVYFTKPSPSLCLKRNFCLKFASLCKYSSSVNVFVLPILSE